MGPRPMDKVEGPANYLKNTSIDYFFSALASSLASAAGLADGL